MEHPKYCNICGNRFDQYDNNANYSIHKLIGYGSKYDGCFMHMNICIKCMDKIIEDCKIKPVSSI